MNKEIEVEAGEKSPAFHSLEPHKLQDRSYPYVKSVKYTCFGSPTNFNDAPWGMIIVFISLLIALITVI